MEQSFVNYLHTHPDHIALMSQLRTASGLFTYAWDTVDRFTRWPEKGTWSVGLPDLLRVQEMEYATLVELMAEIERLRSRLRAEWEQK